MKQNVIQISGRTMINVDVSDVIYVTKTMFGTMLHNCENVDDSAIICNEVIVEDPKLSSKDGDDKSKAIPTNFNKKKVTCKT